MTPFWYRFFCIKTEYLYISTASQCHLCITASHFLLVCEAQPKILLLKLPIKWDIFCSFLNFWKKSRMSTWISSTSYKMMSGAQMWVLKNEVLEKSNTRFPAPPIKNDFSPDFWSRHNITRWNMLSKKPSDLKASKYALVAWAKQNCLSFSTMGGTKQDGIHAVMTSEFELSQ